MRYSMPCIRAIKAGCAETNKNLEYSNFLHTYCDEDYARDISDRRSLTSKSDLFNGAVIFWCAREQYKTPRRISNAETKAIYTRVLDKNWVKNFYRSIVYPIGPLSKLYKDKQATIKIVLVDRTTPQARHLDFLITIIYEPHFCKTFAMVDTRSNMQSDGIHY